MSDSLFTTNAYPHDGCAFGDTVIRPTGDSATIRRNGTATHPGPVRDPSRPMLQETTFSVWHPLDESYPIHAGDESIPSLFYVAGVLDALKHWAPQFVAPSVDLAEGERVSIARSVQSMLHGQPLISHKTILKLMRYGHCEGKGRTILSVTCFDSDMPISVEFDAPVLNGHERDDWGGGYATMTILHPMGTDPLEHPVVDALLRFYELVPEGVREAIEEEERDPMGSPAAHLQEFIDEEGGRTREAVNRVTGDIRRSTEQELRQAQEQAKRDLRRINRHSESLQQQLDTARAIADRQRARADAAERQVRELTRPAPGLPAPVGGDAGVPNAELDAARDQVSMLTLQLAQTRDELDGLREQLHQANQRNLAAGAVKDAEEAAPHETPTTFDALQAWVPSHLDGDRVLIHPKAIRAARKSVFRDVGLVCRALQALNDWYWPMKIQGDAKAGKQWEAFLERERLRCSPTGAATTSHRTRDSYQISYQGRRHTLDLHLQGSSSRKEEDGFRLYFTANRELGKVLIGHFPTHLPSTLT